MRGIRAMIEQSRALFHAWIDHARALFSGPSLDEEMDEELGFHIEMETRKYIRQGLPPEVARRKAVLAFGGVERFKEKTREERGVRPVETFFHDLRFGWRQMRRSPGFSLSAVLTLAVGIGSTVVVFSVFNAVVLRPLPFHDPDSLVRIREVTPQGQLMSVADPNFLDFREQSRAFSAMVAVDPRPMVLTGDGEPVRISTMSVTEGFFAMLGVQPERGRVFAPEEHRRGGEPGVVLISHGLWIQQFGGDPDILRKTVLLDGSPRTVIGVLPADMGPNFGFDAWFPFAADPGFPRSEHRREVFARVAPGVSISGARDDLSRVQRGLGEAFPASNGGWDVSVVGFRDWIIGPQAQRAAQVLLGAVGLLLLLACASVSNLLLARGMARERELSLRAALGAPRARIVGQLLAESLVLAAGGAFLGVLIAAGALPLVRGLSGSPLPRMDQVSLDWTVALFAVVITMASALISGGAPALRSAGARLMLGLRVASPSSHKGATRLRAGLVVGQLALATVLLVGAGLLSSSFLRMASVDPGFEPENLLLVEVSAPVDRYPEMSDQTHALYRDLLESVHGVPGVSAAGATMASPLSQTRPSNFVAPAEEAEDRGHFLQVAWRSVTPGFFEALGVPLLAGRIFTEADADAAVAAFSSGSEGSMPVILGRSLARRLWPDGNPVGRTLVWNEPGGTPMTVLGVVEDIRDLTFPWDPAPAVYLPHRIAAWPTMTLVVRTNDAPSAIARQVREAIWGVEPSLPVPDLQLMDQSLRTALAGPRLNLTLLALFSVSALLLATVGLFGLTAFSVARRTREIGIRLALGAPRAGVLKLILGQGMKLALAGTCLGLIGAGILTRAMANLLFGIRPLHAPIYLSVALILGVVTLIASLLPASRGLRVQPASSLQAE